jgi:hypothetical protein
MGGGQTTRIIMGIVRPSKRAKNKIELVIEPSPLAMEVVWPPPRLVNV